MLSPSSLKALARSIATPIGQNLSDNFDDKSIVFFDIVVLEDQTFLQVAKLNQCFGPKETYIGKVIGRRTSHTLASPCVTRINLSLHDQFRVGSERGQKDLQAGSR